MPNIGDWLFGSSPGLDKVATGSKGQRNFAENWLKSLQQMQQGMIGSAGEAYGQGQNYLQGLFGENAFENFAQPYNQQFEQKILPGIAERFAGFGANSGALSSSGFGQALSGGASDFQSQLAQLFSQLQMQGAGQLSQNYGMLQNAFGNQAQGALGYQPFAYHQNQGSTGALIPMLTGLIQGASQGYAGRK